MSKVTHTIIVWVWLIVAGTLSAVEPIRVAHFQVDASPLVGAPLAYDPCVKITDPLSFHGLIIVGDEQPILLCAVDWLGVSNESYEVWRQRLADTIGTEKERVALHAVHQHDAPQCDLTSAGILDQFGGSNQYYDVPWFRDMIRQTCDAAQTAMGRLTPIDEIGLGQGEVFEVASNRRLLGDDGKVFATRYTACADPKLRELPEGTVDPLLRSISFWSSGEPLVVMTYFACHPQSYYRTGEANPDFPGYARNHRADSTGVPHIHFNGAGGNIGAGKWNDGSRENRVVLTEKIESAMERAFTNTKRIAVTSKDLGWRTTRVALPIAQHLDETSLKTILAAEGSSKPQKLNAANHLAWLRMSESGHEVDIQCLEIGNARVLHMPGELFVEYQLKAAEVRPDLFVAMAAYGQYGCGYIGTEVAYTQGGYETSAGASRVAPSVETILTDAINRMLKDE